MNQKTRKTSGLSRTATTQETIKNLKRRIGAAKRTLSELNAKLASKCLG